MLSLSIRKLCQIFTGDNFCHTYTLDTCFRVHSPYSYLVYTLQAHVRFKIFKCSREIIFSCLHSPHMFQSHFFMLTLSTHVSKFTLHTVIWFTLSKHMLGSKFSNVHGRSFFHAYTLHTCFKVHSPYSYLVYTLQAHVRFKIFEFSKEVIISCLHSPHMFQGSLSIQLFRLHSPSTC